MGLPPAALLRQARLPATLHFDDEAVMTTRRLFTLWRAVEDLSGDPAIGIRMVLNTDTALHPPHILAAFHARDYRDGLMRTARFKRLCSPEHLHFSEENGEVAITTEWLYANEPPPAVIAHVTFASLLELGRRATGQHLLPRRVELAQPEPDSDQLQRYFDCPIRYGAPRNMLVLSQADLDRPFPGHNPELLEMLTPALSSALGELQRHNQVGEQIKIVLKRRMASGRPELSDIARELGMSERTLQRRVIEEGTTFRQLLLEARQELGRQLLGDASAEIDEIAYLLGYQDSSSFYRAFRYWEGITPGQWREMNGIRGRERLGAGITH